MKKYFIDCGAHCGESILTAKQRFGLDTHVISFEPIPFFANQLMEIYKDEPTVQILNAAVWINNDIKKFYVSYQYTDASSLVIDGRTDTSTFIDVPCFDLSEWIKETFSKDDHIILKLDIEGAEYEVLNKMINDNTICMIKELWGEWHDRKLDNPKEIEFANSIYSVLREKNITLNTWEIHIPTIGKSHPLLAYRPKTLEGNIGNE
jgi:FkbM family methyltransferase